MLGRRDASCIPSPGTILAAPRAVAPAGCGRDMEQRPELMPPVEFFFSSWEPIARIAFIAAASYLTLIILLRVTGARTLARLDPFDVVIIISLGSTFGRVVTAREVAFVEAVTAFVMLIGLQVVFSWLRARYPKVVKVLAPPPALLYYQGHFLRGIMGHERMAEMDLISAVREHGLGSMEEVEAVILESNGRLAVIPKVKVGDGSALRGIGNRK